MNTKRYHLTAALLLVFSLLITAASSAGSSGGAGSVASAEQSVNWELIKAKSQEQLARKPLDVMANFRLTIALANLGEVETAYDLFEKIGEKISIRDFNQAAAPHLEALQEDEDNLLLLNYAAFSAAINNDYHQAVSNFQKIRELDSQNPWIHNYLAAYQIELEEYNRAEKTLQRALELRDNNYSHFLLAMLNYRKGRILKAILELSRSGNLMNKFLFKP